MFTNKHYGRPAAALATGHSPADATAERAPFAILQKQQHRATLLRRPRPAELSLDVAEHPKVPLKATTERLHRRESRLGLRSLFGGRSKSEGKTGESKDGGNRGSADIKGGNVPVPPLPLPTPVPAPASPPVSAPTSPPLPSQQSMGVRASLNNISDWSHASQPSLAREVPAFAPAFPHAFADAPQSLAPAPRPNLMHMRSASTLRGLSVARASPTTAAWNPPPLFQAYPQAIKQDRLPACTTSAEAILRTQHGHKGSLSVREGFARAPLTADLFEEPTAEHRERAAAERPRRRHRVNPSMSGPRLLEWTTKIYVLVTSGYLLQYAGEGASDRLPEKMLHLGKDSAAFVTDVIPGQHWVLQVSSVADEDGATTTQSSSLLSRLPFRGNERRQAPNFLMVFESGESMDGWIAALRAEIEALGGKKNLSETGEPKAEDQSTQLSKRASLRKPPHRNPERFSHIVTPSDLSPGLVQELQNLHVSARVAADTNNDADTTRSRSFDDESTVSAGSRDGRQLDGLRDSTQRLSSVSSSQPTIVTSAGSSPLSSPVRDSFASHNHEEMPLLDSLQELQAHMRPRMRPNAAAISDRRLSVQAAAHLVDVRGATTLAQRPQSIFFPAGQPELSPVEMAPATSPQATQNFSVPQTSSKRYSLARPPPHIEPPCPGEDGHSPFLARMPGFRNLRRPPPSSLAVNSRPLSSVQDIPSSPMVTYAEKEMFRTGTAAFHSAVAPIARAPSTPPMPTPWVRPQPHRLQRLASSPALRPSEEDRRAGRGSVGSPPPLPPPPPPTSGPVLPTRGSSLSLREGASHVTVSGSPRAFPPTGSPKSPNGEAGAEVRTFILPSITSSPKRARDLHRSKSSIDMPARATLLPPCLSPPVTITQDPVSILPAPDASQPAAAAATAPGLNLRGKNHRMSMSSFMQRAAERTADLQKAASYVPMQPDRPSLPTGISALSPSHHRHHQNFSQSHALWALSPPNDTANDGPLLTPLQPSPLAAGPLLRPSARSTQHLRQDSESFYFSKAKALARRSLPQLAEGPPPAPPPTCALPPVPKRHPSRELLPRRCGGVAM